MSDALLDDLIEPLLDTPADTSSAPPSDALAIVVPFPFDRRRTALDEARRRHPSARTS